jgi:hypothetical protein
LAIWQIDAKRMPRGITAFLRLDFDDAQFGRDVQPALLRHDQQFAVGIVEVAPLHRPVRRIDVNTDAGLRGRTAIARHGEQAVDEIGRCDRQRQRVPAQLVRRYRHLIEIIVESSTLQRRERIVHRRRLDPVEPAAPVEVARRSKSRAGNLLRIQAVRDALRRVLADRQRTGKRLGREFVGEARLVVERLARRHGMLSPNPHKNRSR